MKHALLTTVVLLPLLFACNKQETAKPVTGPSQPLSSLAPQAKESTGPKINSSVHKSGWCDGWPLDCVYLGGVDVKPSVKTLLDNISGAEPTLVAQVFLMPELVDINAYLGTDITFALQSGRLYFVKYGETDTQACYLIGTSRALSSDNKTVALQINK